MLDSLLEELDGGQDDDEGEVGLDSALRDLVDSKLSAEGVGRDDLEEDLKGIIVPVMEWAQKNLRGPRARQNDSLEHT